MAPSERWKQFKKRGEQGETGKQASHSCQFNSGLAGTFLQKSKTAGEEDRRSGGAWPWRRASLCASIELELPEMKDAHGSSRQSELLIPQGCQNKSR